MVPSQDNPAQQRRVKSIARRVSYKCTGLIPVLLSESQPCKMVMYSHVATLNAKQEVIDKGEPYTTVLKMPTYTQEPPEVATRQCTAFRDGHRFVPTVQGREPQEYEELRGLAAPGTSRLDAREVSRLSAFLKLNGGFVTVQTQELGNCLYSSVLRGLDNKLEYTTMHLRRTLVIMICSYPQFFYHYLSEAITKDYGAAKLTEEEYKKKEEEGTLTAQEVQDQGLPGPFSLVTYCEHLLKDGTWGDMNSLMLISCLWQVIVTSLYADSLLEVRIRHDMPLQNVDIVVIHIGGDHFMGCGE